MAYGDVKVFTRRTASDKILCDKGFNIAKNPKYDGYQRKLSANFLIKKFLVMVLKMNCQLLENLIKEKYTHLLYIIFGVLILLICN